MRFQCAGRPALLLILLAPPLLLRAQFQAPTPDELKMTADPEYPGAAAVYLSLEEKTDDPRHFHSRSVRVKILTEAALNLATVDIGYLHGNFTVDTVAGRTIHSDGSIVPLTAKPADLLGVKTGSAEIHHLVFTLPSVEVGSILEYSYQIRYDDRIFSSPTWNIQQRYPVRKAHYFFEPFGNFFGNSIPGFGGVHLIDYHGTPLTDLLWDAVLPGGQTLVHDTAGRFKIDLTDIPPIPDEPWMPAADPRHYHVTFYYAHGTNGVEYWVTESRYWLKDVDHFAEQSAAIRQAAAGIVVPSDTDIEKAQKLYAAVQALDNTDFSRTKSEVELRREGFRSARRAEDTWAQKSGNGGEIALLYLALVRAAGLTAWPMIVVDRDQGVFNQDYLNFGQLTDLVILLNTGGTEIVLDPAEKMCPFKMVHWKHSGAGGVRQNEKGPAAWETPLLPYGANTLTRRAEVTVNPNGAVTARLQFGMLGQEALEWRQLALRVDGETLKSRFNDWISHQLPSGVEAHLDHFAHLDDPNSELVAYAPATGAPGSVTGKRLILPGFFFAGSGSYFVNQPKRQEPVDIHFAEQVKDGVLFHLPAGYTVESSPQPVSIPWPNNAVLQVKSSSTGSDLTVTRSLARAFTIVAPEDYGALRDFYLKVASAEQQQLVLNAASPAQPNQPAR